ncbi:MAG TPA: LamG-like jellyroll fold domain-containing protein, partial [Cyclobacteriaceae bacterium]|nr:LamG-like jellyroll fold domain-containing protein [Cyclobacteriaceae bacterium]
LNQFYHFTVVYSGYSLEIYKNGELDVFTALSGAMSTTLNPLTFGRKDPGTASYYLRGVLDEVRIYNAIVPPDEIFTLKDKWNETVTGVESRFEKNQVYPNPAEGNFFLQNITLSQIAALQMFDINGKSLAFEASQAGAHVRITVMDRISGIVILKLRSGKTISHHKIILK